MSGTVQDAKVLGSWVYVFVSNVFPSLRCTDYVLV